MPANGVELNEIMTLLIINDRVPSPFQVERKKCLQKK
jgi:hypothetical protein